MTCDVTGALVRAATDEKPDVVLGCTTVVGEVNGDVVCAGEVASFSVG